MARPLVKFTPIKAPQFVGMVLHGEALEEMLRVAQEVKKEFDTTTSYWESGRPEFVIESKVTPKKVEVSVSTGNELYKYLDRGVKGHDIIPRKNEMSGTAGTYVAGSLPNTITVDPAGGYKILDGNYLNLNWVVPWPGIEARNFSGIIKEKMSPEFLDRIRFMIRRISRKLWRKSV